MLNHRNLTLVSLLRAEYYEMALVEYNVGCVSDSIIEVLEAERNHLLYE